MGRSARHAVRRRWVPIVLVVAGLLVLLLAGAAYAGYRYDRATATRILPGVRIEGVDVGGMTRAQALGALRGPTSRILDRGMVVRAAGRSWRVTPRALGVAVDVDAALDRALSVNASYRWPARVWHRLMRKPVRRAFRLTVSYDRKAVGRFVRGLAPQVAAPSRDASVDYSGDHLVVVHARSGRELPTGPAWKAVLRALHRGGSEVTLRTARVKAAVTERDLGFTIVVRTVTDRLYLYDGFDLVKTYVVATGQPQYPTPLGHFEIINKRINPTWINPATDTWGKDEPAMIPPGPDNPLGTRALDLNAPGIRIHGTPDDASIGHHASHGCVRMHIPDSEELFDTVPVGTRVIITT
jgi:lipoprotein-anchoring transpeptidase ErfK/SrfK